ncbi:permease [Croceicoccus sp. YJ47]|uniref:CBU_0592 family membrane protein n=1 Tax=Croceicoccus sp. YJ47 TaxID=2798724 RepID=UPI0035304176
MTSGTANIVGFAGMLCIVSAYGYLTAGEAPNPFVVHSVNLLGAGLLAISLTVNTNLPSLVLDGIWACVAIWGLVKAAAARRSVP